MISEEVRDRLEEKIDTKLQYESQQEYPDPMVVMGYLTALNQIAALKEYERALKARDEVETMQRASPQVVTPGPDITSVKAHKCAACGMDFWTVGEDSTRRELCEACSYKIAERHRDEW